MGQKMKRMLGILFSFVMVLALMPGMRLAALADYSIFYPASTYPDFDTLNRNDAEVTIAEVHGITWYVIANDSSTVTLLSKQCFDVMAFNNDEAAYGKDNRYENSDVKKYVDGLTGEGQALAEIKSVISDGPTLIDEDAALALSETKRIGEANDWWLCTPFLDSDYAAFVIGETGEVIGPSIDAGQDVSYENGVRPVIKLDLSSIMFLSELNTFTVKNHWHNFITYEASGTTITATCDMPGCDLPEVDGKHTATLTIAAPRHSTYADGKDAEAVITDKYNIRNDATVKYYKANWNESGYTKTGSALNTAPTKAGDYVAEITLGTGNNAATVSIGYTIYRAEPIAVPPSDITAGYGQTLADVKLTNPSGNTEGTWTWVKDSIKLKKIGIEFFLATFTPTDTENYYSSHDSVMVDVGKGAQTITAYDMIVAYGDTNKRVYAKSDGDGAISYAVKPGSEDLIDVDASTGVLTIKKIGTAAIVVTAAETQNYNAATKEVAVTISKDIPAVNAPTAKTLTFTGYAQELVEAGTSDVGSIQYALGTDAVTAPEDELYSTSIPAAAAAGTYYVWYKVVGDGSYHDTVPACIPVEITLDGPVIAGADLELDGTLDLRFYVAVPEDFNKWGAYMRLSITGKGARTLEIPYMSGIYHAPTGGAIYSFPVYSIEMGETVTAVLQYVENGETRTVSKAYSIREYLDDLEKQETDEKILAEIKAIRNYGHYMQQYLKELHGFTVGEGEGYDYQAMPAASAITPLTELKEFERKWGEHGYDAAVLKSMGYYDSFDASTTLNIRLEFKEAPGIVSATVNGKAWKVKQLDSTTYLIEIPDIDAYQLGKPRQVKVTADRRIVYDAELSALSYVSAVLASERYQAGEAEALTAFYNYYDSVNPDHT